MRVGLYLHPRGVLDIQSLRLPPPFRGLGSVLPCRLRDVDQIGYHCVEYFLEQWDRFTSIPRGVIAHSTHLRGQGTYDITTGVETSRIKVTLATGISQERCRKLGLDYLDPASIDFEEWKGRERQGIVLLSRAGETLYRLKKSGSDTKNAGALGQQ